MLSQFTQACTIVGVVAVAGSAYGAYQNNMYDTGAAAPSSYATLVGSPFDTNTDGGYNWPLDNLSDTTSGYIDELDIGGGTIIEFDRTQLISEVYRVNTQTIFNDGGDSITLNPGDMVFSYRIRLVQASTSTLNSLKEVQLSQIGGPGVGLATDRILGRGVYQGLTFPGLPATDTPDPGAGDLFEIPGFGGSLDFKWTGPDTDHLQNSEEITLLMFTEPSAITGGFMSFAGNPGQDSGVDPNANFAPVLIPTFPTPGTAALLLSAGVFAGARRRR
jgi:hypothetical protein